MKHWLAAVALICLCGTAKAAPYFYVPYVTPGSKLYSSVGVWTNSQLGNPQALTNVAVVYHPLSSGSIIPEELRTYVPPESWSINLGGAYGGGNGIGGPGISVNLLDTVRAEASNLLSLSSNARLTDIGAQIAPGNGPFQLNVGPQWINNFIRGGVVVPIDQWKLIPGWYFGMAYGF